MTELVESELRSLQQNEKISSTDSEDELVELVPEPPMIIDISSDTESDNQMSKDSRSLHNGWKSLRINADWPIPSCGATTVIPHLPAPAEPVSKPETYSEDELVEFVSESPIIIDISSDTGSDDQESSGFGCSNVIPSNDSKPPRTMEMSKDSRSPHNGWKSLRINADWPSPGRRPATRQIARYVRTRGRTGNTKTRLQT